jgi:hypothetical protein
MVNEDEVNVQLLRLLGLYLVEHFLTKATNPSVSFQMIQFLNDLYQAHRSHSTVRQWMFAFVPQLLSKLLVCEEIVKRRIRDLLQLVISEQINATPEDKLT